jgi:hypothetical protein
MKKLSHHLEQKNRTSTAGERHMNARSIFAPPISESIRKAYDRLQCLCERGGSVSLEELQGAVEYLLDKVKAERGLNG